MRGIFCLISMLCFSGGTGCQANHQTVPKQNKSLDYAAFKGGGPFEFIAFENTDLDIKDMIISFDDVGFNIEVCDKPDYLLCIKSPFEIYIPAEVGAFSFENTKGEQVDVVVTPFRDESDKSRVCDLSRFWITVKNNSSNYTGNFFFKETDGLVSFFETLSKDGQSYEPIFAFSLYEGNVFKMAEFCGEGSE